MSDSSDTIRRAAIVVSSLERRAADAILEKMPADQAAAIRQAMVSLLDIHEAEEQSVIQAFLDPNHADPEFDDDLNDDLLAPAPKLAGHTPLAAFRDLEDTEIAECLYHERPAMIAGLLFALPEKKAARILTFMDASKRSRILNIMGLGTRPHELALHAVAQRVVELCRPDELITAGKDSAPKGDTLRAILNELGENERNAMLGSLAETNPLLAERLSTAR